MNTRQTLPSERKSNCTSLTETVMVLIKKSACVVLVFLCAACLSTARLNPKGASVNDIPDIKASIATSVTKSTMAAIDEDNLNRPSEKRLMSKSGKVISAPNVEAKRNNARSCLSDEVNEDPLAFTADYRRPVHHPPKNNK
ncbi:hypothetical protein GLYMA_02G124200v4 [Glycine max]|nr:hypothetical protein GLYMA_02G124200v4 [Glycine max]KAH1060003.1 hypothetical protein GYH30_003809 [Glycine max]